MKEASAMNLSPYNKAVVSAIGTLVAVVIQFLVGDGVDAATLGTAIIGLLTTLGVFQVTNAPPLTPKASPIQPSTYKVSVYEPKRKTKAAKRRATTPTESE
jgi:sugar (pentulose or hexulose) kinase